MKLKFKELRKRVADAKTAWQEAKRAKKSAQELKRLRNLYERKLALIEELESDGKKDEDEIELSDSDKKLFETPSATSGDADADDGAGADGDNDNDDTKTIELEELAQMITDKVGDILEQKLPEKMQGVLTEESVKRIVELCLKDAKIDSTKITDELVEEILTSVVEKSIESIKMPSKRKWGQKDAGQKGGSGRPIKQSDRGGDNDDRDMIEVPHSLTKGNLPLHMKQLLNVLLFRKMNEGIDESDIEHGTKLGDNMFMALRTRGVKAITTTGTGTGAEWIPRDLSTELLRRLYLESQIAQLMLSREIDMPTDPYDLPLATTRPKFYRNNVQNREARASTPGTAKQTIATQKLMALVQYSYEADEDAIIPLLPLLQRLLGEAAADSLESMLINGDSAATHMDVDITDPDDANKSWDGWRKLALNQAALKVDLSTGGITRSNLLAVKKAMGKWGRRPSDLLWITGGLTENAFLNLDEVITADKRGAAGTTLTGTINSYWGIPIVVSEVMREDLNAAGVYDGVTVTKGSVLLVNMDYFILGNRRSFMIEVAKNIKSQTNDIVASFRKGFKPIEAPSASARSVSIGYNFNA